MTEIMPIHPFLAPAARLAANAANEADCVGDAGTELVLARRCVG